MRDDVAIGVSLRSTLDGLDLAALSQALKAFTAKVPAATGGALLSLRVRSDGTVEEARYLGGSIGDLAGATLAEMMRGRSLFPEAKTPDIRTAFVGPIALPALERI